MRSKPIFLLLVPLLLAAPMSHPAHAVEQVSAAFQFQPAQDEPQRAVPQAGDVPEVLRLPAARLAAADTLDRLETQEPRPGAPFQNGFSRAGAPQRVEIAADTTPTWLGREVGLLERTSASTSSWLGRFVVEDAYAFRIRLEALELPKGAAIWLHSGDVHLGPFGHELIDPEGGLWLPPAPGPEVVLEIELTGGSEALEFSVGEVMEMIPSPDEPRFDPQVWTACDVDTTCVSPASLSFIDFLEEAIARLTYVKGSGSYLCSGGLMNDNDPSGFRPYLLTANHCFDTQSSASSLVAYFDYRTSTCNGSAPSLFSVPSVSGSTLRATNAISDFTLVELSGTPSGNNTYLGWTTADPTSNSAMYRVSHPAGTAQKYSASSFKGSSGIVCSGLSTSNFHYSQQTVGSTTGGSSGSPVVQNYSGDPRVVGQLYGICRFTSWDECSYNTYNQVDGAFSTTFPYVRSWLYDMTGSCDDAFEPDDSSGTATTIASGVPQSHSLCPAGDEDWVRFTLASTSAIEVETSGASGDTRIWLYDSSLSQVEFDDDDGPGLFSSIDRTCASDPLPAGTYYVKVDEFGDNDPIDAYTLSYDLVETCGGGGCPALLTLSNTTLSGTQSHRASDTITLGPSLVVSGTSIDLLAGEQIVIQNGTRIGGSFSAGTHPSACSL